MRGGVCARLGCLLWAGSRVRAGGRLGRISPWGASSQRKSWGTAKVELTRRASRRARSLARFCFSVISTTAGMARRDSARCPGVCSGSPFFCPARRTATGSVIVTVLLRMARMNSFVISRASCLPAACFSWLVLLFEHLLCICATASLSFVGLKALSLTVMVRDCIENVSMTLSLSSCSNTAALAADSLFTSGPLVNMSCRSLPWGPVRTKRRAWFDACVYRRMLLLITSVAKCSCLPIAFSRIGTRRHSSRNCASTRSESTVK